MWHITRLLGLFRKGVQVADDPDEFIGLVINGCISGAPPRITAAFFEKPIRMHILEGVSYGWDGVEYVGYCPNGNVVIYRETQKLTLGDKTKSIFAFRSEDFTHRAAALHAMFRQKLLTFEFTLIDFDGNIIAVAGLHQTELDTSFSALVA